MDSLKSYLLHSIEFVLNRLNDRFHESDGIRYLVTHIDRILCILSRASSLFNIPPQLECSLQRAHQLLVTLSGDDNSLQRRLFKFSGYRARSSIDIPRELLEQILENNFTPEQSARLFCVCHDDPKTHRWMSTPLWKTQFSNRSRIGRCYVSRNSSIVLCGIPMLVLCSCVYQWMYIGSTKFVHESECYFKDLRKWYDLNK